MKARYLTSILSAAALLALAGVARADSFAASPQDYPSMNDYAHAYSSVDREALKTKYFNPLAYQCGAACQANQMTAIERRVFLDNVSTSAGDGGPAAAK